MSASNLTATALTRDDVLFIVGFLAGAKSDPVLLALVEQLETRWSPAPPEGREVAAEPIDDGSGMMLIRRRR